MSNKRQYLVATVAMMSIFNCGLDMGWPTSLLPKIFSPEYPFEVSNAEASYIVIISYIGVILGGLISSFIVDIVGRKMTLLFMTIPHIVGFVCIYLSTHSKILLYVGRFIGGHSDGSLFTIYAMYVTEIADPKIRGTLGLFSSIAWSTAQLFVNLLGHFLTIQNTALILLLFPILFVILMSLMPETPYFYIMKSQITKAEKSMKFLSSEKNVDKELIILSKDLKRQMSEPGTFKDLFIEKHNRKAFALMITTRFFDRFSGSTSFYVYMQILLSKVLPTIQPVISSSFIMVIQLCSISFTAIIVDRYGRKFLLVLSSSGCFIALIIQAIFYTVQDYTNLDVTSFEKLPLIMMVFYMISYCLGIASLINIVISEMFSAKIKAKAVCILNVMYGVLTLISTKFYEYTMDNIGMCVPFYVFGIITFCGILFFKFILLETRGKSLEQIQQELLHNNH